MGLLLFQKMYYILTIKMQLIIMRFMPMMIEPYIILERGFIQAEISTKLEVNRVSTATRLGQIKPIRAMNHTKNTSIRFCLADVARSEKLLGSKMYPSWPCCLIRVAWRLISFLKTWPSTLSFNFDFMLPR